MSTIDPKKHLRLLRRRGLSLAEWYTLSAVGYGALPREGVPRQAARCSKGDPRGSVSMAECRKALSSCISKGLLRRLDDEALREIQAILNADPGIGPIYGLPIQGQVDFTVKGAQLFQKVLREMFGENWAAEHGYEQQVSQKLRVFFRDKKGALKFLEEIKRKPNVLSVGAAVPVGAWRVDWWCRYPKGYCIELERGENQ